jgi:prepilin-type N-terminal cleavage/methylation domain-containing protein
LLRKAFRGFTLVELLIVLVILSILASLAVPAYLEQAKRTKYAEVINATSPFKLVVEACFIARGTLTGCSGGAYGIPANITSGDGYLNDLSVVDGVITADGDSATFGLGEGNEYTYILTPAEPATPGKGASLLWTVSGTCLSKGYC